MVSKGPGRMTYQKKWLKSPKFIPCLTSFYKLFGNRNSKQVSVKKLKTCISALVSIKGRICIALDSDPLKKNSNFPQALLLKFITVWRSWRPLCIRLYLQFLNQYILSAEPTITPLASQENRAACHVLKETPSGNLRKHLPLPFPE